MPLLPRLLGYARPSYDRAFYARRGAGELMLITRSFLPLLYVGLVYISFISCIFNILFFSTRRYALN